MPDNQENEDPSPEKNQAPHRPTLPGGQERGE
jgi:hypothetical protein